MLHENIFDNRHGYPGLFSIYRCDHCGFCRTEPSLDREELTRIYREYYPRSLETSEQVMAISEKLKDKSPYRRWIEGGGTACYQYISPGKKVLDLGCGNCLSLLMAQYYGARQVIGIDVDPNILPIAQQLHLDVHIGQLSDLPAEKGLFDYILVQQVIEHEPEPRHLLLEIKERLNKNGQVILSFPNVGALYRYIFHEKWLHWHPPYHINHFSRKSVILLAEQCGFTILKIRTVTPDVWMTYQLRTLRIAYVLGQRDPFWDPGVPDNLPVISLWNVIPRRVRDLLFSFGFSPAVCIANRILDTFGFGESFVMQLSG
jgi:2-polyprenyl-3-methyl-5-hydroxy-6-metoxy-1,4-benzoquinol methylase